MSFPVIVASIPVLTSYMRTRTVNSQPLHLVEESRNSSWEV